MKNTEYTRSRPEWHGSYREHPDDAVKLKPTRSVLKLPLLIIAGLMVIAGLICDCFRKSVKADHRWWGALETWMGDCELLDSGEIIDESWGEITDRPADRQENIWFYFEMPNEESSRVVGFSPEGQAAFYDWDREASSPELSFVSELPSFEGREGLFALLDRVASGELVPQKEVTL